MKIILKLKPSKHKITLILHTTAANLVLTNIEGFNTFNTLVNANQSFILENLSYSWYVDYVDLDYSKILLLVCCTKKLFECPVATDLAKESAFSPVKYPFFFQIFLRIRFFDIEVRFFGTAIQKQVLIFIVVCERHILFEIDRFFSHYPYLSLG